MPKKLLAWVFWLHRQRDMHRLLLVQVALAAACLWFGVLIYELQAGVTAQLMLLLAVPQAAMLAVSPSGQRWFRSLVLAAGLMGLCSLLLPAGWFQGSAFVPLAMVCAALGMQVFRQPAGADCSG